MVHEPDRGRVTSKPAAEPDGSSRVGISWIPLFWLMVVLAVITYIGAIASTWRLGRGIGSMAQKPPGFDARWIDAAPGSAVRAGDTIIARVRTIAGTTAPQFGVDSFMVYVAEPTHWEPLQFEGLDTLVALVRPTANWSDPVDLRLAPASSVRGQPRVGTLRIDAFNKAVSVYSSGAPGAVVPR